MFFGLVLWVSESMEEPPRAIELVNNLFFTWDTDDIYMTLMNESGHRLISILSAYKYGFENLLGGGIGSWPVSSVNAMEAMGMESFEIYYFLEFNEGYFLGIRPTAFAAGLFLEAGLLGTLAFKSAAVPVLDLGALAFVAFLVSCLMPSIQFNHPILILLSIFM